MAHSGVVNCVRIGRGSAGVLATGGEDKKVNLWRIGQTEVVKVGLVVDCACATLAVDNAAAVVMVCVQCVASC